MNEISVEQCFKRHDEINIALSEIKVSIAELPEKIIDRTDKRYASKLSEKVIYAMVGIICIGVLTALLATVVHAFR